jgi:hypothetical protein
MDIEAVLLVAIATSKRLLENISTAQSAWQELWGSDTRIRNLDDELVSFALATSTVRKELSRCAESSDDEHYWTFRKINELLVGATATTIDFTELIQDMLVQWSTSELVVYYQPDIDNMRIHINMCTTALCLSVLLLTTDRISNLGPLLAAHLSSHISAHEFTEAVVALKAQSTAVAFKQQSEMQSVYYLRTQFTSGLVITLDKMYDIFTQQERQGTSDIAVAQAVADNADESRASLWSIQEALSNLGFEAINDQLEALRTLVASVETIIRRLQDSADERHRTLEEAEILRAKRRAHQHCFEFKF